MSNATAVKNAGIFRGFGHSVLAGRDAGRAGRAHFAASISSQNSMKKKSSKFQVPSSKLAGTGRETWNLEPGTWNYFMAAGDILPVDPDYAVVRGVRTNGPYTLKFLKRGIR